MPPVVIIAAEIVADYLITGSIIEALALVAIGFALDTIEKALNAPPKVGTGNNLLTNYSGSESSIRVVIGEVRIGGLQTIAPVYAQENP